MRLLDFGLAKLLAGGHETRSSAGTPEYMAPEQIAREPLGPWTDLYAVGIIACELITGRLPFAAEDFQALAWRKLDPSTDPTADLAGLELPDEVLTFLRRALARDPARRYRDVAAMRLGLLPAIRALPATRAPLAARRHPVASADPTTTPVSSAPPRPISEERDLAFRRWLEREEQRLDRRR